MGVAYRALDGRLGRQVAIKVLPASVRENADRLRRFEQEARTIRGLNHGAGVVHCDIKPDNVLVPWIARSDDHGVRLVSELSISDDGAHLVYSMSAEVSDLYVMAPPAK